MESLRDFWRRRTNKVRLLRSWGLRVRAAVGVAAAQVLVYLIGQALMDPALPCPIVME